MSFALPSVKSKPELPEKFGFSDNSFGVPNAFTDGFKSARNAVEVQHPLALSERNYAMRTEQLHLNILKNTQGLHAPLRIAMERQAARKVGRLPFLQSSNLMLDVLTGRDIDIGPEDIFNTGEFMEMAGQPHAVIERSLGLL